MFWRDALLGNTLLGNHSLSILKMVGIENTLGQEDGWIQEEDKEFSLFL